MQTTGEFTSFFTPEDASLCNAPYGYKRSIFDGIWTWVQVYAAVTADFASRFPGCNSAKG